MSSNKSPRDLSLPELQEHCTQETLSFRQGHGEEGWHCYEIFRRAIVEKNERAWDALVEQYRKQVTQWVTRYSHGKGFQDEPDFFVNSVFEKFWRRNFSPIEFSRFPNVKSLMGYLRMCVGSVMLDYGRVQKRIEVDYLDDLSEHRLQTQTISVQTWMEHHLEQEEFWNDVRVKLNDDQVFKVVYASFVLKLKPLEIFDYFPSEYGDIQAIYKIKAKALRLLSELM